MFKTKGLIESQIYDIIKNKEFDKSIINSKKNVAIVMSQSWCPQWTMVKNWINDLPEINDLDIYVIIYDREKFYNEFLDFKENILCNFEIPYIRYYINGKLIKESNYTTKDFFLKSFELN